MARLSEMAKWIGREIAGYDRIWAKSSLAQRAERRAAALDIFEPTRPAAYALAWGVGTGRSSAEFDAALVSMSAPRFAQTALDIAEAHGGKSVRDVWDAWKSAVRSSGTRRSRSKT